MSPPSSTKNAPKRPAGQGTKGRSIRRAVVFLSIVAVIVGGQFLWRSMRNDILRQDDYRVTSDEVVITPLPDWIRTDLKQDVLREAGIDYDQSLLDPLLAERVARAFELHPWVAEVKRVSKSHPARVEVELVYRRPICMVEVPGGLYPIDSEGVVLPSADFSPIEARSYPRLAGITSAPLGPVGSRWGDGRVHAGAQIAAVLAESWEQLGLAKIEPVQSSGRGAPSFVLVAKDGTRIIWGHAPHDAPVGEAAPEEKITKLKKHASDHGSADDRGEFDLRPSSDPAALPSTAAAPSDTDRQ